MPTLFRSGDLIEENIEIATKGREKGCRYWMIVKVDSPSKVKHPVYTLYDVSNGEIHYEPFDRMKMHNKKGSLKLVQRVKREGNSRKRKGGKDICE